MPTYDPSEMETGEHLPLGERRLSTAEPQRPAPSSKLDVDFGAISDQGKRRTNNEDHYLVARYGRAHEPLLTNLPPEDLGREFRETGYALIVADGLGGEAAGEVASRLAISTLVRLASEVPDWILKFDPKREQEAMRRADTYLRQVHEALAERAKDDVHLSGMSTTMTLATILGADGIVAHVGDSRAYLFRKGALHQLTRDQTQAQMLLEAGVITKKEFARNQYRHVLLQAIGGRGGLVDVEIHRTRFEDDDRLLLCTDGLTDMVDDDAIAEVLGRDTTAQAACESLRDLALEAGGRDNVTAVLGHLRFTSDE